MRSLLIVIGVLIVILVIFAPLVWSCLGLANRTVTTTKLVTQTIEKPTTVTYITTATRLTTVTVTSIRSFTAYATITRTTTTTKFITIPPTPITITKTITVPHTITATSIETRTVVQSIELAKIEYNFMQFLQNESVAKQVGGWIASWVARANESVLMVFSPMYLSHVFMAPVADVLENLSTRGINITIATEGDPDYVLDLHLANRFCRWIVTFTMMHLAVHNLIVLDDRIVIVVGEQKTVVMLSPELADLARKTIEAWYQGRPIKPLWCGVVRS